MKTSFLVRLEIEGLYPEGALQKLKREGIPLYFVRKTNKKRISVCVERKYRKKVFTILQNSCYNIIKEEYFGLARLFFHCAQKAGFFIGAAAFALFASFSNVFVLRIDVVGTGDYYRPEILSLLEDNGVTRGKPYPDEKTAELTARILGFENVSFCSLKKSGSVLRVEVQTSSSSAPCKGGALSSPATGTLYALTVIRGAAQAAEGDEVKEGQILVGAREREEIVMASARVLCQDSSFVAAKNEEEATASRLLAITAAGETEILEKRAKREEDGFFVEIVYLVTRSLNM